MSSCIDYDSLIKHDSCMMLLIMIKKNLIFLIINLQLKKQNLHFVWKLYFILSEEIKLKLKNSIIFIKELIINECK